MGFPSDSVLKNPPANAGDARYTSFIPGSGRSPKGGNGNPLQCSCLENAMDRGPWWATVHGVTEETKTAVETPSTVNKPPAFCLAGLSKVSPGGHRQAHTSLRSPLHTLLQLAWEGGGEAHHFFQVVWSLKPGTFSLTKERHPHGVFWSQSLPPRADLPVGGTHTHRIRSSGRKDTSLDRVHVIQ